MIIIIGCCRNTRAHVDELVCGDLHAVLHFNRCGDLPAINAAHRGGGLPWQPTAVKKAILTQSRARILAWASQTKPKAGMALGELGKDGSDSLSG